MVRSPGWHCIQGELHRFRKHDRPFWKFALAAKRGYVLHESEERPLCDVPSDPLAILTAYLFGLGDFFFLLAFNLIRAVDRVSFVVTYVDSSSSNRLSSRPVVLVDTWGQTLVLSDSETGRWTKISRDGFYGHVRPFPAQPAVRHETEVVAAINPHPPELHGLLRRDLQ